MSRYATRSTPCWMIGSKPEHFVVVDVLDAIGSDDDAPALRAWFGKKLRPAIAGRRNAYGLGTIASSAGLITT